MSVTQIQNAMIFNGQTEDPDGLTVTFGGTENMIRSPLLTPDILVDSTGCTVLPGLIDSSVHTGIRLWALRDSTAYGITTNIDLSTSTEENDYITVHIQDFSGMTSYFGTGTAIGPGNVRSYTRIHERYVLDKLSTPAEAVRVVNAKVKSTKSKFIKVILDQPGLSIDVLSAVVAEAHNHDKLAIGFASQVEAYRMGIEAGIDVLTPVPVDGSLDDSLVRSIVARDIAIIPTLRWLQGVGIPSWASLGRVDYPCRFSCGLEAVQRLYEAGACICAGSCAGSSTDRAGSDGVEFGQGLLDEMLALAEAGMSNEAVLRAATANPASVFGLTDRGILQRNKRADIVIVEGNPSQDLAALYNVRSVWIHGVRVRQAEPVESVESPNRTDTD